MGAVHRTLRDMDHASIDAYAAGVLAAMSSAQAEFGASGQFFL